MSSQPAIQHPEPSEPVYELFLELAQIASRELDNCESTPDPAEARYKFDVVAEFAGMLEAQTARIPDAMERRTCQIQVAGIRQEIQRIAHSIPYICQSCFKPWLPEDGPENEFCAECSRPEPSAESRSPLENGR